jgi:hypothetical protein
MSTLDKISEALRNLDSDSPVAEALSAVVGTEKADASIPLVDAAGYRMAKAFHALHDGGSVDDVRPMLKSASALLLAACGELAGDYRVMSKAEFEEFAAGEIAKAAEGGIEGAQLEALRTAIDVASVLFKGDNADKKFTIPLPVIVKADATEEPGEGDEEGEGEGDDADTNPGEGEGEKPEGEGDDDAEGEKPEGEKPEGDADADGDAEGDKGEGEDVEKKDDDADDIAKAWPIDMSADGEPAEPVWGFDPK